MMRSKVVLPQPEGPSNTTNSWSRTSSETPFRALNLPKVFSMFSTRIEAINLLKGRRLKA